MISRVALNFHLPHAIIGHCCWRLFKRPGYRGRSLILSGNANLHTTHRRGFFSRVRSVRKIQDCT